MTGTRKEIYEDIVLRVEKFHNEHKMKKFKILKVEVWTYFVEAETKEEAEQKCIEDWICGELEEVKILSSEEITNDTRAMEK